MKKGLRWRLSISTVLLIICLIFGSLFGAGVALASSVQWTYLSVGAQWYELSHESYWPISGQEWEYDMGNYVSMTSDRAEVAVFYTTVEDGEADEYLVFGPTWIWDEQGENSECFWPFVTDPIDGCDDMEPTYWYYDELDDTNNHVIVEQYIWYMADWPEGRGSDMNVYITQPD